MMMAVMPAVPKTGPSVEEPKAGSVIRSIVVRIVVIIWIDVIVTVPAAMSATMIPRAPTISRLPDR
jgi:hypothetical protein